MLSRFFKPCHAPEPPTRAPVTHKIDNRSRLARRANVDVWLNRDGLSFDMVIGGCTCPPCTLRDFMNYLIYVERNAENLQFFLWHRDYARRFYLIAESQRQLSPEWTGKKSPKADVHAVQPTTNDQTPPSPDVTAVTIEPQSTYTAPPGTGIPTSDDPDRTLRTPPVTDGLDCGSSPPAEEMGAEYSANEAAKKTTNEAPQAAEETRSKCNNRSLVDPIIAQPFRKEISKIYATYIANGASRQLNLTSKERENLMGAMECTTHPSAFKQVVDQVEWTLRHHSHPNFIRWTLNNCNRHRVLAARILSSTTMLLGLIAGLLPIFSSATRAWRALSALVLLPGLIIFLTSCNGSCILFLFLNRRHLHPWELFSDEDEDTLEKLGVDSKAFDSTGESNSYEDEPWIPRYRRRNFFEKVFDPDTRIQDPVLRRMHFMILLRISIASAVITAILVTIFVSVPKGNYF
ncbi:hypothetical protein ACO22_00553 [Paracoccidioides brasiliensis]|uniref:RGS domain-containing protein n=1 Tax=Paracoccidioides brasiliensis TaxID=121759 RepID=A0A1D2JP00_PARBR|nr:hypothetical protein ACO22_00553 [Paracoccidioides brasiliensis]